MVREFKPMRSELEKSLLKSLGEQKLLNIKDLQTRVRRDVAYVDGNVPNLKQKRLVSDVARQVDGVRDVVNALRIVPLPVIDDASIKIHVTEALAASPQIDETATSVEVADGVVSLTGFVTTMRERCLIEWEAWSAPGVLDLVNKIEIVSPTVKNEIHIAGGILQDLVSCLGLDASNVAVELHDGVARLHGTVPGNRLKSAAEEVVRWNPQVVEVVNQLKVVPSPGPRTRSRPGQADSTEKAVH
ncbi:MAG: BON domain-containing protein [Bacteroidetes bacterium]|nr:BON domain-containing protein [Bacteroidota bacterium]